MYKYALYYDKSHYSIGIRPIRKMQRLLARVPETREVVEYNDCYYLSSNVELLKTIADDIKNEWIQDLEEKIKEIQNIEI